MFNIYGKGNCEAWNISHRKRYRIGNFELVFEKGVLRL